MGSEKKRKRVSTDAVDVTPSTEDKAQRKKLKKLKKEAAAAAAAAQQNGNGKADAINDSTETDIIPLLSPIASPMAGKKLMKKLKGLIGSAAKEKALRRGIKEVALGLKKKDTGLVVMAGDVFPVEVIAHIPLVCEEANVPYCFFPTKLELGNAGLTKRPTSVLMVSTHKAKDAALKKELDAMQEEVKQIQNLY